MGDFIAWMIAAFVLLFIIAFLYQVMKKLGILTFKENK